MELTILLPIKKGVLCRDTPIFQSLRPHGPTFRKILIVLFLTKMALIPSVGHASPYHDYHSAEKCIVTTEKQETRMSCLEQQFEQGNVVAAGSIAALYFQQASFDNIQKGLYWLREFELGVNKISEFTTSEKNFINASAKVQAAKFLLNTSFIFKAREMMQAAASHEYPRAYRELGESFEVENGQSTNFAQAAYWYSVAAELNDVEAHNRLASLYSEGKGVIKSKEKAYEHYLAAYAAGDVDAGMNAAAMKVEIENRLRGGVRDIYSILLQHFYSRRLTEHTRGDALTLLASVAQRNKDMSSAFVWLKLAAEYGDQVAQLEMELLGEKLTAEQHAEAAKKYNWFIIQASSIVVMNKVKIHSTKLVEAYFKTKQKRRCDEIMAKLPTL